MYVEKCVYQIHTRKLNNSNSCNYVSKNIKWPTDADKAFRRYVIYFDPCNDQLKFCTRFSAHSVYEEVIRT